MIISAPVNFIVPYIIFWLLMKTFEFHKFWLSAQNPCIGHSSLLEKYYRYAIEKEKIFVYFDDKVLHT